MIHQIPYDMWFPNFMRTVIDVVRQIALWGRRVEAVQLLMASGILKYFGTADWSLEDVEAAILEAALSRSLVRIPEAIDSLDSPTSRGNLSNKKHSRSETRQ